MLLCKQSLKMEIFNAFVENLGSLQFNKGSLFSFEMKLTENILIHKTINRESNVFQLNLSRCYFLW